MKILVTGGGGFLGRAVVLALHDRGDDVRILGRSDQPDLRRLGVDVVRGDVADAAIVNTAVMGCDAVIHSAAKVGSWGRAADFYSTNVTGTQNVIDACRAARVGKLIFTSSPSVAHAGGDIEGIDESHPAPTQFDAHYPRTKAQAERLVLAANSLTLSTVALRPHLLFGPGDTHLLPRALKQARAGRLRLPGGPPKLVDCTYIDNAVDAHLLALDHVGVSAPCAGRAYFISQGQPLALTELINRVLGAAGEPPVRKFVSPRTLWWTALAAEAIYTLLFIRDREPPVTRFVARQLTTAHWFNLGAARRDLGYIPRVSIDEGLARLARTLSSASGT